MDSPVVIFVANRNQWDSLLRQATVPPHAVVASMDFDLTCELGAQGHVVLDLFGLVDAGSQSATRDACGEVLRSVEAALRGRMLFHGYDLGAGSIGDLDLPMQAFLIQAQVIRGAMDRLQPAEVWTFEEQDVPQCWDPPRPPPDVMNAVVAALARARGVPTRCLVEFDRAAWYQGEASAAGATGMLEVSGAIGLQAPVEVIMFCPGMLVRDQELLLERLARTCVARCLVVADACPAPGLPFLPVNGLWILPFDMRQAGEGLAAMAAMGTLSQQLEQLSLCGADLARSPYVGRMWERYCEVVRVAALHAAAGRFLGMALRPRVAILRYDDAASFRAVEGGFRSAGVPCIAVDHSGMGLSSHRHRGGRAHAAVWGEIDAELHRSHRHPEARIRAVGSLRHTLARASGVQSASPGDLVADRGGGIACFVTSVMRLWGSSATSSQFLPDLEGIAALAPQLGRRLIFKLHPRYGCESVVAPLVAADPEWVEMRTVGSAAEVLGVTSVAILYKTRSTAALECMLAGVPTVYFKDTFCDHARYGWAVEPYVEVVRTVGELRDVMVRLRDDAAYLRSVLDRQAEGLRKILAATGEAAVDRMLAFMAEVARPANEGMEAAGGTLPRLAALLPQGAFGLPGRALSPADDWLDEVGVAPGAERGGHLAHMLDAHTAAYLRGLGVWSLIVHVRGLRGSAARLHRRLPWYVAAWFEFQSGRTDTHPLSRAICRWAFYALCCAKRGVKVWRRWS